MSLSCSCHSSSFLQEEPQQTQDKQQTQQTENLTGLFDFNDSSVLICLFTDAKSTASNDTAPAPTGSVPTVNSPKRAKLEAQDASPSNDTADTATADSADEVDDEDSDEEEQSDGRDFWFFHLQKIAHSSSCCSHSTSHEPTKSFRLRIASGAGLASAAFMVCLRPSLSLYPPSLLTFFGPFSFWAGTVVVLRLFAKWLCLRIGRSNRQWSCILSLFNLKRKCHSTSERSW